jgi:hypothetical protein
MVRGRLAVVTLCSTVTNSLLDEVVSHEPFGGPSCATAVSASFLSPLRCSKPAVVALIVGRESDPAHIVPTVPTTVLANTPDPPYLSE